MGRTRNAAAMNAANEVSTLVVSNKTFKAKIEDVKKAGNYVTFTINSPQVLYARERTASGMVVEDSSIEPRKTKYISLSIPDLHNSNLPTAFKIIRMINHGRIDELALVSFFDAWATFKIEVFHAGDVFTARDGSEVVHQHDGQNIVMTNIDLDAKRIAEAKELVVAAR